MFQPKFSAKELPGLAARYLPAQKPRVRRVEADLLARAPRVRSVQILTKNDFELVCSWNAVRAKRYYENNTVTAIREITAQALSAAGERNRIDGLRALNGVEYGVASTILHFFHRDTYPILSYPSLWSLSADDQPHTFEFWRDYTQYFRQLVTEWDVSRRALDRALWQYHHENAR